MAPTGTNRDIEHHAELSAMRASADSWHARAMTSTSERDAARAELAAIKVASRAYLDAEGAHRAEPTDDNIDAVIATRDALRALVGR